MKKIKTKPKTATNKEVGASGTRGQMVRLKAAKPRTSWLSKLPSIKGHWNATTQFLVEAIQELKKVTWPNRKETLGTTGVVLILVVIIAVYLGLVDFGLSRLVRVFIH
jgi:preprotein translocase subunit SecE